ncbi:MAG: alpha/beta fold hydrolase [Acidobacteriota bacterium]|nr:alpha/beta fold hydrolase [Acidobacteriota bacterium]
MPTIRRPDATVAYDVVGSGPPVILGHSLFCTRSMWREVVLRLQDEYQFVNVELRGHGESTAEAAFTLSDLVDDWLAIMDREAIDKAVLCGLSTGGMTAMRLAVREPDRVAGLALFDTNADPERPLDRIRYAILGWAYTRFGLLPRKTLLRSMFSPQTLVQRRELVAAFLDGIQDLDRAQLAHAMNAVFGRGRVDVGRLTHPTLVAVGESDMATPPVCARRIAQLIDGATLEVIRSAGHLTAEEQPEAVASVLRPFLERCLSAM